MQTINYTTNPVSVLVSHNFPVIRRINEDVPLDDSLERMTRKIAENFQKDSTGKIINSNGAIPGWDGEYLSANKSFMDYVRESILNSDSPIVPVHNLGSIDANVVKVSKNLASEYFNMTEYGNHNNNLIAPMGIYIIPIIYDNKTPLMIFERRPSDAFFDPGRLNAVSKALTVSKSDNYLNASIDELNKKYRIDMHLNQVQPIGMTSDNVHNITHPFGYAKISKSQAQDYDRTKISEVVPVREMPSFLKKNSIESWTYTGLAATYLSIVEGLKEHKDYNKLVSAFKKEFDRVKKHPVHELSSIEILGLNPF